MGGFRPEAAEVSSISTRGMRRDGKIYPHTVANDVGLVKESRAGRKDAAASTNAGPSRWFGEGSLWASAGFRCGVTLLGNKTSYREEKRHYSPYSWKRR